jgi:modulator of FtsH protease
MNVSQHTYARNGTLPTDIRKTLSNTFIAISGMWVVTAIAAAVATSLALGSGAMLGLFLASFGVLFGVMAFRNSPMGLLLLAVFSGLEGLSLGPLLNHYLNRSGGPQLILSAAGLTASATFACALYCMTTRKNFSRWGSFLFAGLIVVVVASVVSLFFPSTILNVGISAVACMLFTAYMLYDIAEVVNGNETSYITAALSVYLDMLNLFLHLLRLLGFFGSLDD